jgi:Sulfatase
MEHASSITRTRARASSRWREPAVRGAQLLAVSGFALAQPLFDILGKNAEFFAVRGSAPSDIVLFAVVVTFAPALVLLAVEVVVELVTRRSAVVLHHVFLAGLGAVFGVQALKRSGVDGTAVLIVGAIVIGLAVAVGTWRVAIVRSFLTILAGASVVFLGAFLLNSKVESLVFPKDVHAVVTTVDASTPVVFLMWDEFPIISVMNAKEQIDARRFPNFARLARSSNWYRTMTSVSPTTTYSVPSALSGVEPKRGKLPLFQNYPNNLFTLLGRRYKLNVTETQTRLCPSNLCAHEGQGTEARLSSLYSDARTVYLHLLAPPALEDELPPVDESWGDFGSDTGQQLEETLPKVNLHTFYISRLDDFGKFLGSLRAPERGRPTLNYLHVLMPHGPWLYFPDGRVRAVGSPRAPGRKGDLWTYEPLAEQAWQRHLLQVGYTDVLLGRLIDRLQKTGLWDKALIVVTADEGDSFRGNDYRRNPSATNLSTVAFIPLFVKLPGQTRGRIVDRRVTTVDILPTIADVLDVRLPWKVDGRSVLKGGSGSNVVQLESVKASLSDALAQRKRSLRRQIALFGTGTWGPQFAGTGQFRALVGKSVSELNIVEKLGKQAVVDKTGSKLLRSLPNNSALIPSPLTGYLPHLRYGQSIALALNGRIAAVSHTFGTGGKLRFSLLASDTSFRAGRNDARIFLVTGATANPELRELDVTLSS